MFKIPRVSSYEEANFDFGNVITSLLDIFRMHVSEPTKEGSEEGPPFDENPDDDSLFSEHCMEYDGLERCWLLLVPRSQ